MKKIFTFFGAFALSAMMGSQVNAQVFNLEYINNSDDTIMITGTPSEVKPMIKFNLETGVDSFKYNWQIVDFFVPAGWSFEGLCDNITCHVGTSATFQVPYPVMTSTWVYNNPSDPNFTLDLLYVWMEVQPQAPTGLAFFKFNITTDSVYPIATAPATPQVQEMLFVVRKDITTSIDQIIINDNSLKLYPNPATTQLNVKVDGKLNATRYSITDIQGRELNASALSTAAINIEHLAAGTYFLSVYNDAGIKLTTKKFSKN